MATQAFNLVGRGVFSLGEASRLTGIPSRRIRRWLTGYEFRSRLGPRYSPPPVQHAPELLDLARDQVAFRRILDPYLFRGLEFGPRHGVARWWHEAGARKIVIDPERSLGSPIVARWGVPTLTLSRAFRVEQSLERVAAQFEIPKASVAAAVEFEQRIAA